MAAIRGLDVISRKWSRVSSASGPSYEEGVTNPVRDFMAGALAANDAWKAGTNAAVAGDRFATGVRRASTAKWQRNAIAKGPARFAQGVQIAQPDYEAGFAPYREAISAVQLPPRGARRSPQNLQRVATMVQAIATKKEQMLRGGR
jgi:hypothetical protein